MHRARTLSAFLSVSCLVGVARAAPTPEDQALSTTLFREAKVLLEENRIPEACRKLEESQRLFAAPGTLLNLAVCHEKEGKTATAWAEYVQSRSLAERDHRDDRLELIDAQMKALEPKLSKIVIVVDAANDRPDMEITVDDRIVRRPAWGTPMPVDPGEHAVEARALAKKKWSTRIEVQPEGDVRTVTIPAWEDEPVAAVPSAVPPVTIAPTGDATRPPPSSGSRKSRTTAFISGGVGIAGIATGTVLGIRAITKHGDSVDLCKTNPCSPASVEANDAAKASADASTVAFAVGIVGLGVATYFWFFAGGAQATTRKVQIGPGVVAGTF